MIYSRSEGERALAEATALKGAPLTQAERAQLGGFAVPAGAAPKLEAMPDPTSSTGFRWARVEQGGEAPPPEGGVPKLSDVSTFRGQYNQLSQPFLGSKSAIGKIRASVDNPSPAGDLSLISIICGSSTHKVP